MTKVWNQKSTTGKKNEEWTNTQRLNNTLLRNNGSMTKSKNKPESILKKWKSRHNFTKSLGWIESNSKREAHSDTGLPQETRKITNNHQFRELENKVQTQQKEGNNKE